MTFFFTSLFIVLVFWRPQEWLFPWLYNWNILDGVVFMSLLTLVLEANQKRIRFFRGMPQPYLLAGLWFAAVCSHIAHTYWEGMMWTIPDMFKICFFTFLLFCVLNSPSRLRAVAAMFVVMSCVMAVHALMQERLGSGFGGLRPMYVPAWGDRPAQFRSYFFGIFGDPNDLAQILATSIPFTFVLTRRRSFWGFLLGCTLSALLILGILATHSRGGLVALLVVAAVVATLFLPARWLGLSLLTFAIIALILCPFSARYLDESAHDRVIFWGQANWAFKENLFFGVGYQMFTEYIEKSRASHNAFVMCYTELGLFGYWFWFILLQLGVVGAWRTMLALKKSKTETVDHAWLRRFSGLAMAAMAGFCVSSYFLSRAFIFPLFFLFAILGVLPFVARDFLPEDHPPLIEVRRDVFIFGTAGTLLSVAYIYFSIILLNKAWGG